MTAKETPRFHHVLCLFFFFPLPYFNGLASEHVWYSGIQRLTTMGLVSRPHPIANRVINHASL